MKYEVGNFVKVSVDGIVYNGIIRKINRKGYKVLFDLADPKCGSFFRLIERPSAREKFFKSVCKF